MHLEQVEPNVPAEPPDTAMTACRHLSSELLTMPDGAACSVRRYGTPEGPRVVLSHGNGFACGAMAALVERLGATCEVVAFDLRNHGQSPLHRLETHCQSAFAGDLERCLDHLAKAHGAKETHGLFHSISGLAGLCVALKRPGRFATLVLCEPPAQMPAEHPLFPEQQAAQARLVQFTLRRRADFADPAELADRLRERDAFEHLDKAGLAALATAILRQSDDGRCSLACPPDFEAKIYETNADEGLFARLRDVPCPTLILSSGAGLRHRVCLELVREGGFDLVVSAYGTHLLPMERPGFVAAMASAFYAAAGEETTRRHRRAPVSKGDGG